MDKRCVNAEAAQRFELRIGDELAGVLDYVIKGDTISLTRSFTSPKFRGQGLAAELVSFAVGEIAATGRRIVPMCWYVEEWFQKHPDMAALLARTD